MSKYLNEIELNYCIRNTMPKMLNEHKNNTEINKDNTDVINDPLGHAYSLASGQHCFHFVLLDFEKVGTEDGRKNGRNVRKR